MDLDMPDSVLTSLDPGPQKPPETSKTMEKPIPKKVKTFCCFFLMGGLYRGPFKRSPFAFVVF